jgi:hypothetical protein
MLLRPQGKASLKKTLGKISVPVKGDMRKRVHRWLGKHAASSIHGENKVLANSADIRLYDPNPNSGDGGPYGVIGSLNNGMGGAAHEQER